MAGLAQAWSTVTRLANAPDWPGNALWIIAALVWLITLAGYLANVAAQRRWKTELSDPTFGPFTALIVIVPMLLGVPLAEQARGAGEVMFGCGAILTVLAGAWITAGWITLDGDIRRWHPGYFLPMAAGGLLGGGGSAALGFTMPVTCAVRPVRGLLPGARFNHLASAVYRAFLAAAAIADHGDRGSAASGG